jgi:hypothetical protein
LLSPNQFALLSDSETDIEDYGSQHQPNKHQARIPLIVIYSYLNNHSTTLKQMNDKLSKPVDVKSKSNRLLLYTKSSQDYNLLVTEIRTPKLAYHTYSLPENTQPRLVLNGIALNIPKENIINELNNHNIQPVRVTQLKKWTKQPTR